MNVDPAPMNDPEQIVCIRTTDAHRIIDEARDARCSRCGEAVWLPPRTEDAARGTRLICSQCFASEQLGRR